MKTAHKGRRKEFLVRFSVNVCVSHIDRFWLGRFTYLLVSFKCIRDLLANLGQMIKGLGNLSIMQFN